jgi:tetratricopeptide (TPR) repeat protein
VRELQHALRSYRRAEYAQAEASLTRLVDADKGNAAAWFWRARTRQKQGQPLLAVDDYGRAADLAPAGQIYACQAYCYALERDYAEAIRRSNKAIRAGFKSAELYNNLGYCYSCQGRYADAVRFLDEALRLKPRLRPALHNRACAEHNWAGSDTQHRLNPRALTDIEMALQGRPLSGYLFLDAARIYARAGDKGPPDRERIHRYLSEAVRLGSDPEVIRRVFANLFEPSTLEALLAEAKPAKPRPVSLSLVDPMFDDAFSPR